MCGIYGIISGKHQRWNIGLLRALVLANEARGTDSVGFFDSSGKMVKAAVAPSDGIRQKNITAWLERSSAESWFIAGHTRLATRGAVNRRNSHPFRYGRIIGSHNGIIDAPDGYVVDSQYLFDLLAKAKGNYQDAWRMVCGYWGISWFDGENFYLQVHNGELSYCNYQGVWVYSSSAKHLESCVGYNTTIHTLTAGETIQFLPDGTAKTVEPFVSAAPEYWGRKYGCSNTTEWYENRKGHKISYIRRSTDSSHYIDNDSEDTIMAGVKDYDSEWREAWAQYSGSTDDSDDQQVS